MTRVTRTGVLLAFMVSGFAVGAAVADDATTTDEVDAWGVVSVDELGETRGGTAVADADANVDQSISIGGSLQGGTVNLAQNAINESSMSITAINTGNNVVMLNSLAIDVCLSCTVNP